MMKKFVLVIVCILFVKLSYPVSPGESASSLLFNNTNSELGLNNNYQQFKFQVVNFESTKELNYAQLKKKRRRKKDDNLMLYVAGGIAVATATLILVNDPDNFTSNSTTGVNLGIAAGGTVACGLIITKFFIDKRR